MSAESRVERDRRPLLGGEHTVPGRGRQVTLLTTSLLPVAVVTLLWWIGWETRIDDRFHPMVSLWSLLAAVAISVAVIGAGIRRRHYFGAAVGAFGLLIPLGVGIALQLGGDVDYALGCRQYHECSDAQFMLFSLWGIWGSMTTSSNLIGLRFGGAMEGFRRVVLAVAAIALGTYGGYAVGWWYGVFFGFIGGAILGLFVLFMPRRRWRQTDSTQAWMEWGHAHEAVEQGDLASLVEILDRGADVDDPDWDGATLLHHAIDIEVNGAAQSDQPLRAELTRLLVTRGANLGWRWRGQTPLETALARGHDLAVDAIRAAMRKDSR